MMTDRFLFFLLIFATTATGIMADNGTVTFNRDVRPILSDNCFACHGFDEKERKADLRLDEPGADMDELLARVFSTDPDEVMPPPEHKKTLTDTEKATLEKWVEQGAKYEKHWSFVAPQKPGEGDSIDFFLERRLRKEGLEFSREAEKETLIRRVTLDLVGLPPTLAEVEKFLADQSPDAYEKLVEELQSRPTYGEHMARYWLDLARYADTHGLHLDNERSMWPYRDWVVRALNENVSFDDFTRWQLAGDLLENPTRDQLIASGFNRCNVTTSEGGSINEEWIYRYAVDRTATAVEVWMGLTAGCAVCHDHKFDPLSTKEFYSMYAFFHSAADPAMDGNKIDTPPILKLTTPEEEAKLKELDAKIAAVDTKIDEAVSKIDYTDPAEQSPLPTAKKVETVWFEDAFPTGTNPQSTGNPLQIVTKKNGEVFSGGAALKRTAKGGAQDFFSGGATFTVPKDGKFFVHCFLDPNDVPEQIMVQFHTNTWKNRATWGTQGKIGFGKPGTNENRRIGDLPEAGEWIRLEFDAKTVGLNPGMKVTGYAFTQFGGTVTWDRLGVESTVNPSTDPTWSWAAWKKANAGKRNNDLPEGLRQLVRGKQPEKWTEAEAKRVHEFWLKKFYAGARESLDPLEAEKAPYAAEKTKIEKDAPITFVMADLPEPRESFVMIRGAYDKPGEKVSRGVPSFLPPLGRREDRDYNRLDFANWLVSGEHPLTARVAVNRFWQQFFGTGLVKTSADFGSQGEVPSHPELLDWLAVTFSETDGWDMKKFVKRLVTSRAYRQHSAVSPELIELDPENRLLARGPRFRLDAEIVRDQALKISGLLVPAIGGKGVNPYQPPNIWEPVAFGGSNTKVYKQGTGDALYRRSLYTFLKRTAPPPFMASFDAPNREQSCTARGRSNTPMQALQLMNDIQHVEAARNFAQRMMLEGGDTPDKKIAWAWRVATAREPEAEEIEIAQNAFEQHRNRYASDEKAATELIHYGESKPDESLNKSDLAAYTLVANLILNLDEVVNKN
ncbi:MAG: DUF1553 domain-containing protein [Verrucomicrobiales bacterium]|nr:DUF1553 domain-containing protein [Verrucomicrobiales bacterium]